MIYLAVIVILALIAALAVFIIDSKRQKAEREREAMHKQLEAAQKQADIEKAERLSFEQLAKKTEEINYAQIKQRDKISTGDDGADFAGSIDVLSELSKKRPNNRN